MPDAEEHSGFVPPSLFPLVPGSKLLFSGLKEKMCKSQYFITSVNLYYPFMSTSAIQMGLGLCLSKVDGTSTSFPKYKDQFSSVKSLSRGSLWNKVFKLHFFPSTLVWLHLVLLWSRIYSHLWRKARLKAVAQRNNLLQITQPVRNGETIQNWIQLKCWQTTTSLLFLFHRDGSQRQGHVSPHHTNTFSPPFWKSTCYLAD